MISLERYLANRVARSDLVEEAFPDATPDLIRLDLNEGAFAPPPQAVSAMQEVIERSHKYPDTSAKALSALIASRLNVPASRIVVASGTNELIAITAILFLDPACEVIVPNPTFIGHTKTSSQQGARIIGVDVDEEGGLPVEQMLESVTERTKLMYITTPHNPTGAVLSRERFQKLVRALPPHVFLYLDEAYYEFGVQAGAPDYLSTLMERDSGWICTRTFSKAYGLAGVRVGYGVASSEDIAAAYRAARPNFTTNLAGLAGAQAAFGAQSFVDRNLTILCSERDRLGEAMSKAGFKVLPTAANFVMGLASPAKAATVSKALEERSIIVRLIKLPRHQGALRITVGSSRENDRLIDALQSL